MNAAYGYAEALVYTAFKRRAFDKHIKPLLPKPLPAGVKKVWLRVDLDRALAEYAEQRNGRPGVKGGSTWVDQQPRASSGARAAGKSTRSSVVTDFATAAQEALRKRRAGSNPS